MNSKVISSIKKTTLLDTFESLSRDLVKFLAYNVGCYCVAQDLCHDTYLRLRKVQVHSEKIKNPKAYVYKIAKNIAFDHLRKERVFSRYTLNEKLSSNKPQYESSPEAIAEKNEELNVLRQAINDLPPKCREVFILSKFESLTYTEISRKLGISVSAVEKHVMKGLAHCRDRLNNNNPKD